MGVERKEFLDTEVFGRARFRSTTEVGDHEYVLVE